MLNFKSRGGGICVCVCKQLVKCATCLEYSSDTFQKLVALEGEVDISWHCDTVTCCMLIFC
jgi:hypothetical protein